MILFHIMIVTVLSLIHCKKGPAHSSSDRKWFCNKIKFSCLLHAIGSEDYVK